MADETIINEIVLRGAAQVEKDFGDIGDAGVGAIKRISDAMDRLPDIGSAASKSFGDIAVGARSIGAASDQFAGLNTNVSATRLGLAQFLPAVDQSQTLLQRLSGAFSSVIAGFKGTASATGEVSSGLESSNHEAVSFGHTISALARATGEPELARLGHTVTALGRAFAVVAPAIVAIGLERVASAGAAAAGALADVAAQLRVSAAQFSAFQSVGSAAGLTSDKLGSSLKGVQALIKDTADKEAAGAAASAQFADQLTTARDASADASKGFLDLNHKTFALNQDIANGKISFEDYAAQMRGVRDQSAAITETLSRQDEQTRKLERSMQLASVAAIQDGTALQKLGIRALDTNGKLKKSPDVMLEIADALRSLPAGLDKTEVEFDLVAAGLDRRLLPALRQGSAAFKDIQAKSRDVNPGFTDAQIATADAFTIAAQQASDAWSSLVHELGIAIAPSFLGPFKALQDLLVKIKPGVVEFGQALAQVVGPILTGVATIITSAVVPVLQGLLAVFQLVADGVNAAFGTNVTGMQLFVAVLLIAAAAFGGVAASVTLVVAGLGLLVKFLQDSGASFASVKQVALDAWASIASGAGQLVQELAAGWQGWADMFAAVFAGAAELAAGAFAALTQGAQGAVDTAVAAFAGLRDNVVGVFTEIRDFVMQVWSAISDKLQAVFGGDSAVAQIPQARARGGPIFGPGSGTSDSVHVMASAGEFFMQAKAVRKYGLGFMHAINSMRFDPAALGMALGGLVSFDAPGPQPRLRFAEGGAVPSRKNVLNLTIGGEQFSGLAVEDETMGRLTRFATIQQVRSAGNKPGWKR